jgi:2-methylisocitrate lyase-like PEP mutase family enzyme
MAGTGQLAKAERLRALHAPGRLLILPCAWDAASARLFEASGFAAVGTTSAGIAATLGFPDGEKIAFDDLLAVVRRIVASVDVPVSVDAEAGFARSAAEVAANMRRILDAGAVGINIEDEDHERSGQGALHPVEAMLDRIRGVREMGQAAGIPFFINARTDAIRLSAGDDMRAAHDEAVRRASAYGAAGADCVFVPGDLDLAAIRLLVQQIPYGLNIVAKETTPPVAELRDIGVRRLSLGSGPMRATMGLTAQLAGEILAQGTYRTCFDGAMPYGDLQRLLARG